MQKNAIAFLLGIFLLLDLGYSFSQHLHVALDGDLAAIVVPADKYAKALHDPLGLSVLNGERYCAPNRFFVHGPMVWFFRQVPQALQAFVSPVESIYLACAILKTLLQFGLIWLLAAFANAEEKGKWQLLWAMALVTPFFQSFGYNLQMGIIEKSITYTFFYPFPMAFLLAFFLPFYRSGNGQLRPFHHFWLLPLAMALPLSGPLVPGVLLIVCPVVLLYLGWQAYREQAHGGIALRAMEALRAIPTPLLFYFSLTSILSLWSLYVGSFNSESVGPTVALVDRYPALIKGLASIFTLKLGFPLLTLGIAGNLFLIGKFANGDQKKHVKWLGKWLAFFLLAYLLLLPLGGYRSYRTLIIRHDTILPVTLALVYFYAKTSLVLLRSNWPQRHGYAWGLVALSLAVTAADLPEFDHNACEKAALETIARSTERTVKLESDCLVLTWEQRITHPNASILNAKLLQILGVTKELRLYYSE